MRSAGKEAQQEVSKTSANGKNLSEGWNLTTKGEMMLLLWTGT